jgi:O-antigen/teichoic acid export membrane protein
MTAESAPPGPGAPSLRQGTAHNLTGQILPAIAALIAIPIIQHRLGDAQLGVLLLAWSIVGYLGIFDLGFRRALTHVVATDHATGSNRAPRLVWTTCWLLIGLGIVCAVLLIAAGSWLVPQITASGLTRFIGAWAAVIAVAVSLPFVAVSSGLRGAIEGHQRFDLLNAVRTPTAVVSYLGPMIAALMSPSVAPAIVVLAATRVAGTFGLAVVATRIQPALKHVTGWTLSATRDLAVASGWMTVANVAGSAMLYLDRFVVGALAPLAAVAYYTTPQEMIGKLLIISAATSSAAFPAMSRLWASRSEGLERVYERTHTATLLALFVPALALGVLAPDWMSIWIGPSFASHAVTVVWWVSVGTFLAGMAATPLALLQATDRSGLTAAFQLVLLPIFAAMAWMLTLRYGIEGAAAAWTIRMALENVLLLWAARRVLPHAVHPGPLVLATALLSTMPFLAGEYAGTAARILIVGAMAALTAVVADRWLGFEVRSLVRFGRPPAEQDR